VKLLEVDSLDVSHGLLQAVRGVTIAVDEGETVALIGANGAGKTTLMRAIAGAHRPDGGRVGFDGLDVTRMPAHRRVRMGIALVPEGRRLFPELTVEENLLAAGARGRKGPWTVDRVLMEFPMLEPLRKRRASTLSGGEQQAAAIARALMSNPRLLLLDEVSLGLAPLVVTALYVSIQQLIAAGTTILLVEQDLARALAVAGRAICMLEGRVVLEGRSSELSREQVTAAYFGMHRARLEARSQ
jgi:branched-chain amino acid transport system ATP-binding protein